MLSSAAAACYRYERESNGGRIRRTTSLRSEFKSLRVSRPGASTPARKSCVKRRSRDVNVHEPNGKGGMARKAAPLGAIHVSAGYSMPDAPLDLLVSHGSCTSLALIYLALTTCTLLSISHAKLPPTSASLNRS